MTSTSQLPCLTSDPETHEEEPTFIVHSKYFGVLNVEIGQKMTKLVKLTSTSQLPSLTSDPETCEEEPTFIFYSEYFGVLNFEIG